MRGEAAQIAALDSWRGIFALAVALLHAPVPFLGSETAFVQSFYLAVDFFLVLSGFVIAMNYESRLSGPREVTRFAWRRFWRLYPLHITTLAVLGLMVLVMQRAGANGSGHQADATLGDFLRMAALLHAFGTTAIDIFNWPSWSISAEIWSYLVFASVVLVTGSHDRLRVALYGALGCLGLAIVFSSPADPGRDTFLSVTGLGIGRGLFGFFAGVLAWRLFEVTRRARLWRSAGLMSLVEIGLVTLLLAGLALIDNTTPAVFGIVALFPAMVIVFAHQGGIISRALQSPALVKLGALSYGIYLWHLIAAKGVGWVLYRPLSAGMEASGQSAFVQALAAHGLLAAYLGGSVIAAALSYRLIERPLREWSRRTSPADLANGVAGRDLPATK
ncbi:acyltransferase family protein [Chelatococcus asaccharovorans]|uniref:acyltransferase family protein n=1 Tax=Chelatococcus asaccharovorans TaxID=28210 RepID=UPI00224C7AC2|nr:acyltransferase [Chelatococcus asaccharovorans]CAH1670604.1 Peptidoglycan/LPS O-acetylase OafA/YrhL [Chelatococcus asaccharovorans]CAH1677964.1 Peptidoglycan/LPS O-acetylase OafA/YrhL [Chelatococcus asaccharovorans]